MLRRPFLVAVLAGLLVGGCSQSDDATSDETTTTTVAPTTTTTVAPTTTTSTAPTTTTTIAPTTVAESQAAMVIEEELVYAIWGVKPLTLDMYAPVESAGAPIVIYLPGRGQSCAWPWMVEGMVDEGAFVFVVRYAVPGSGTEQVLADHGADFRDQAESVACAIHFARAQASDFGSNDPVVVLTGFSRGTRIATHVALFGATLEARWDEYAAAGGPPHEVECETTDGSTHVDALVGMAGPYDVAVPIYDGGYGRAYQQARDPELWEFLSSSIGANPDLKVRLIHGTSDYIPVEEAAEFAALLSDAGYDADLATFNGFHHEAPPLELFLPTIVEVLSR